MEERILQLLSRAQYTPLTSTQLCAALGLSRTQMRRLEECLARLEQGGRIARVKQGNRYILASDADLVAGRLRFNRQGVGFLQPDEPGVPEVRVAAEAAGTAMHGDRVLVRREMASRGRRAEDSVQGRVVRVLESARTRLVGTLQRGRQFLFVVPDDPRIGHDILVPTPTDMGRPVRVGDKVVVELREWKSRQVSPEGEVVEVLGAPDEEGVDMLSVLRQYNLPLHFPRPVLQEARAVGTEVKSADLAGRVDCRALPVVTIDPEDAKDFDDALCLQRCGANQWKLWVHIADVSHYVKPGSVLDKEAYRRGNSTYLVDRVIPMLPEALSNELCSLKPHVERLTQCVEFLLDAQGRVLKTQFYRAVIRSQCRYNYKEVFALLQKPPLDSLGQMLHHLNELTQKMRRGRFQTGALDLDFPESRMRLDEQGKVLRIELVENDLSHQLVEECMLLANEAVAARLMSSGRPAVYRIHEPPEEKRLREFREDVLSHHIPCGNLMQRAEVQRLLQRLTVLPVGPALKIGFLRSLMRARYAVEPLGHYGLAKKKYTHFTSPIRRYADLVVHRALFPTPGQALSRESLSEVVEHISQTERNSDDAERDSREVKLFAFLQSQLQGPTPQRYAAMITEVRNFGFFVDTPALGMSGLVPLSGLSDDFYQFNPMQSQLVGRRTRRTFKLGDRVEVQVAKVDTFKRQVDFQLAPDLEAKHPQWQPDRPRRPFGKAGRRPLRRGGHRR